MPTIGRRAGMEVVSFGYDVGLKPDPQPACNPTYLRAYFSLKRLTRPAVSTIFCLPV